MYNVEIKARCGDHGPIRTHLENRSARFVGEDRQVDTYFRVARGRLKLREGNIEHALIFYDRADQAGPKRSDVSLYHPDPGSPLKSILIQANGILTVVDKRREIYFIDNVKFHLDRVEGLGTFVEIEAIDRDETIGEERLHAQCRHYLDLFEIPEDALLSVSYSDLLLRRAGEQDGAGR